MNPAVPPPASGMLPPLDPPAQKKPAGKRHRGRFAEVNAFIDFAMAGRGRAEVATWLVLWRDTKPNGIASTSQADIARRAGCDVRSVRRALDALVAAGLVKVVKRGRLGAGPSAYKVRGIVPDGSK